MRPFEPSFGSCAIDLDGDWLGTVICPGSSDSVGGSVTLHLETQPGS
jgi:hypothetical protein